LNKRIKVAITGALGRMGQETVRAVLADETLELVGIADTRVTDRQFYGLTVYHEVEDMLTQATADIMVDFTIPTSVKANAVYAIRNKVTPVIGTTGLSDADLLLLEQEADKNEVGVAVIPNFAIGAVLMMKMAREAAQYLPQVEIIELHHDQKRDAPSGTSIKTAQLIAENRTSVESDGPSSEERIAGVRGGTVEGIPIHSIRLPGLLAHQEVLLGGRGQLLTIRHDSFSRESFMPGVILTIKRMYDKKGLIYGLENLL